MRVRQFVNIINLATPLGVAVALGGRARLRRGPNGLILAMGYRARIPAPRAPAVTIGDVVLLRLDEDGLARRPRLLEHESRHSVQYAFWLGPLGFLPAYLAASLWSWWHTGDFALRNGFEVHAGLVAGGYVHLPVAGTTPPTDRPEAPDRTDQGV
jgi:hypothetical protein